MLGVDKLKKSVQDMLGTVANLPEDVRDNAKQRRPSCATPSAVPWRRPASMNW
jgi:hypothetical protein